MARKRAPEPIVRQESPGTVIASPSADEQDRILTAFLCRMSLLRDSIMDEWEAVFGPHERLAAYWSNLTGLDVIAMDERLLKAGDTPMGVALREQYGEAGADLVDRILAREREISGAVFGTQEKLQKLHTKEGTHA